jgi:antitoxin component of RelBE/YafQ-DinJ toxin-antitoxin module
LVALLKLNSAKPEAVKVAAALSLKQDATAVLATFAMPVKDAVDLLKAEAARKAAKQAANEAGKN